MIRAEFVSGRSQAKLAKKYHVSRNMIARKSSAEHWMEDRAKYRETVQQKVIQKTAEAVSDNAVLAAEIKREGLKTLCRLLKEFDTMNCTEHRDLKKNAIDIKRLRDITAAFKDLTDDMNLNENSEPVRIIIDV